MREYGQPMAELQEDNGLRNRLDNTYLSLCRIKKNSWKICKKQQIKIIFKTGHKYWLTIREKLTSGGWAAVFLGRPRPRLTGVIGVSSGSLCACNAASPWSSPTAAASICLSSPIWLLSIWMYTCWPSSPWTGTNCTWVEEAETAHKIYTWNAHLHDWLETETR